MIFIIFSFCHLKSLPWDPLSPSTATLTFSSLFSARPLKGVIYAQFCFLIDSSTHYNLTSWPLVPAPKNRFEPRSLATSLWLNVVAKVLFLLDIFWLDILALFDTTDPLLFKILFLLVILSWFFFADISPLPLSWILMFLRVLRTQFPSYFFSLDSSIHFHNLLVMWQ